MPQLFLLPQAVAILKQLPLIIFDKCPSNRPYTQPDYGSLMPFLTQTIIVKNLSSPYYMSKKCAKYTYMYVYTHSHLILIKTFEVMYYIHYFQRGGCISEISGTCLRLTVLLYPVWNVPLTTPTPNRVNSCSVFKRLDSGITSFSKPSLLSRFLPYSWPRQSLACLYPSVTIYLFVCLLLCVFQHSKSRDWFWVLFVKKKFTMTKNQTNKPKNQTPHNLRNDN